MHPVFLVARRDYLAYVSAWGFWLSLLTAPLLMGAVIFAPLLLSRAEPPRVLAVVGERATDAALVRHAFETSARESAREEIEIYLRAAASGASPAALAAFDAESDLARAISAARDSVRASAPNAAAAFPTPMTRYLIANAPASDIEGVKPYLDGQDLPDGRTLYGALNIRRDAAGAPLIEYWSVNLQHDEPTVIARNALRLEMQREALAAQGLPPNEADKLSDLEPETAQFDPRQATGDTQVTSRQRAPFIASIVLAFVLWAVVFSAANMLLTSVIEEKSNKILDTLLTSVSPLQMLIGKLLGVAALSATLFAFWGALGGLGLSQAAAMMSESRMGDLAAAFLDPQLIAAFAVGFVAGYLMYGAVFLALGSLCESIQETQTLLGPVMFVLMMPMLLLGPAIDNPSAPLIVGASWIPTFTPFLILIRAPAGLSWGEIAGMGAVMGVSIIVILIIAARVFQAGVVNQLSATNLFGRKAKAE